MQDIPGVYNGDEDEIEAVLREIEEIQQQDRENNLDDDCEDSECF